MSDADLVDIASGPGDLLIELGRLVPPARRSAEVAGNDPTAVGHSVLDERLFGFRPYSLITIRG